MHHLAWGLHKKVHTWPIYFVNGFKFHTEEWSIGKKAINCGVYVKDDNEKYYYGIVKEIMQVEYIGELTKQLVIFNCEWFDNTINHGIKVQPQYDIVKINYRRRYSNFDPFIFATNAIQLYYVPYSEKIKEKVNWWVVIKTKPRCTVDDRYTFEVAYQESTTNMNITTNEELLGHLVDGAEYEELDEVDVGVVENSKESKQTEEEEEEEEIVFESEFEYDFDDEILQQYRLDDDFSSDDSDK